MTRLYILTSMRTGKSGRMGWLTLISSQFIYLVVIALLCQLDDGLLLLRESRPQLRRLQWERWLQLTGTSYRIPSTSDPCISTDDRAVQTVANLL